MNHNFTLVNADTDSITVCKPDGSPFSENERNNLLEELNSLFPKGIRWEDDGYYKKVVVLKAKNYILLDENNKLKIKGSALKASTKPPALKEFIKRVIDSIINHREDYIEIYNSYVKEISNITDIKRWASRKTISDKVLEGERTNETRIRDVLKDTEYVEGDKIYTFYKDSNTLELVERFNGVYDKERLYGSLNDTAWVFETILDCEHLFPNYKLKKNKKLLEALLNE